MTTTTTHKAGSPPLDPVTPVPTPACPVGVLASYWYYKSHDFSPYRECPLILDSGAFSAYTQGARIDLGEYAEWCDQMRPRWQFAFNLDVLGDSAASLANWRALKVLGVDSVPVIHFGDRPEEVLPPYLKEGATRIALGGLAARRAGGQARAWSAYCFRWLRDHSPLTKVHGLGIHTSTRSGRMFPWSTTDSTALVARKAVNDLMLWLPSATPNPSGRGAWGKCRMDGHSAFRAPYANTLRDVYGMEPEHLARFVPGAALAWGTIFTRVEIRGAVDFNRRNPASPRTDRYLVLPSPELRQASWEIANCREAERQGREPWPWPYEIPPGLGG